MRILGIETSCDETAVAVVEGDGEQVSIVSNAVASQADLHARYGGVVPEVAAREHVGALFALLERVSGDAKRLHGVPWQERIDAIAVTAGPGLLPALRVGVTAGAALAHAWGKPLVAVNHLEGHVYSVLLEGSEKRVASSEGFRFPLLALLVSGGHTELVLMRGHGAYEVIGATRDDAAGEAFDKVAKLLGLGYPGGPAISAAAKDAAGVQGGPGDAMGIAFPRPMMDSGDFDFSFSGLKTAVRVHVQEHPDAPVAEIAASFQDAVVDVLVAKTARAAEHFKPASVILAGGVSANAALRERLSGALSDDIAVRMAPFALTGDNAAMIAAAGYFRARAGDFADPSTLVPDAGMRL